MLPKINEGALKEAVNAWQLYYGSEGLNVKIQDRFYKKAMRLTSSIGEKIGSLQSAYDQLTSRARSLGKIIPRPGKDY